ncbi:hypothetical protein [Ornithinimicrobium sp. Y1694]|uniref:hypothetical protein n=1 Tax=Ornithinimicrobium sp. Y1694 TaxID=3418590 RepID=UPI003CEA4B06
MTPFVSVEEAAEVAGCSVSNLLTARVARTGPRWTTFGTSMAELPRYDLDSVVEWAAKRDAEGVDQ